MKNQLIANRLMQTEKETSLFEEALNFLSSQRDIENIAIFCEAFDDDTEHHEVMFSLVHTIESYSKADEKIYYAKLIMAINKMNKNSTEWQDILFYRLLNSPIAGKHFAEQLAKAEISHRDFIINILQCIRIQDPEFEDKINEVLKRGIFPL